MRISFTITSNADGMPESIRKAVERVNTQVVSRGARAGVKLKDAATNTLNNPSPSAPGNPPGVRSGTLKNYWVPGQEGSVNVGGASVKVFITNNSAGYAGYLESGTRKMAARPFRDKVIKMAIPEITAIYSEPYL